MKNKNFFYFFGLLLSLKLFCFTPLYPEYSLYLAPLFSLPIARSAEFFESGLGGEFFFRQHTPQGPLGFLQPYNLKPMLGLSFSNFSLQERATSRLSFFHGLVGLGYPINLPYRLQLIPRLATGLYYANFLMAGQDESLKFANPLWHMGNSLQFSLSRELSLEFSQSFTTSYVGKPIFFYQVNFSLGITLTLGLPPIIHTEHNPIAELQASIVRNYEQGNYLQASKEIEALERIAPEDLLVEKYRSLIYQQQRRQEAEKHRREGRSFRAIVLLKQAPDIPEAVQELAELRESLSGQVESLLSLGIAAYEKEDFDSCIASMEKILLINPMHPEAQIYLPRAMNRKKALQRLK